MSPSPFSLLVWARGSHLLIMIPTHHLQDFWRNSWKLTLLFRASVPSFENFIDSLTPSGFSLWNGGRIHYMVKYSLLIWGPCDYPPKRNDRRFLPAFMFLWRPCLPSPPLTRHPPSGAYHYWLTGPVLGGCRETVTDSVTLCLASFVHGHRLWDLSNTVSELEVETVSETIYCFYSFIAPTVFQLRGRGRSARNQVQISSHHRVRKRMLKHEVCLSTVNCGT